MATAPLCQKPNWVPCQLPSLAPVAMPSFIALLWSACPRLALKHFLTGRSFNFNCFQDEELAAQGVQVLRDDILDKTVKLNVEYKVGTDSFVSVHIGEEDVGKNLVEDGLLLVERQRGRKLEKLVKGYEEAMGNAKKNHLNIWRYGDITQDDSREFGAPAPKPQR